MAVAQVGSLGAASTGTTTATPSFGQATSAGNFLVCWATTTVASTLSLTGVSGWSSLTGTAGACVFYKPNCGASETAPTVNGTTFTAGALAEFSGVALVTPLDHEVSAAGTSSPAATSLASPDLTLGELLVACTSLLYSMATTKTTSHAYNNGATATAAATWNNDATSTANHFRFSYGITTGNASADQFTDTFTTTNLSSRAAKFASFELPIPLPPVLVMAPHREL